METSTIKLTGLTCTACQKVIEKFLKKITGVEAVKVNLDSGLTTITANRQIQEKEVTEALANTHYKLAN